MSFPRVGASESSPSFSERALVDRLDAAQAAFDQAKARAEGARASAISLAGAVHKEIRELMTLVADCQATADALGAAAHAHARSRELPETAPGQPRNPEDQLEELLNRRANVLRRKAVFEGLIQDLGPRRVEIERLQARAEVLDRVRAQAEAARNAAQRRLDAREPLPRTK
jgi:hypothetical protein